MEERLTYEEIRKLAMESAYRSCRSAFKTNCVGNYPIEKIFIFGGFFNETYEAFDFDLDELMWRTLELILWRGIAPPGVLAECSRIIEGILSCNSFEDLVAEIPPDEARQLHIDLVLLEFLPDPGGWRSGAYHQ
jgi:hypothetical protein